MKAKIHPKYMECKVTCGCGETFTTRATKPEINVEICSKCHPFFTGKQKLVDTAGRVEKFERRYAKFHAQAGAALPPRKARKKAARRAWPHKPRRRSRQRPSWNQPPRPRLLLSRRPPPRRTERTAFDANPLGMHGR